MLLQASLLQLRQAMPQRLQHRRGVGAQRGRSFMVQQQWLGRSASGSCNMPPRLPPQAAPRGLTHPLQFRLQWPAASIDREPVHCPARHFFPSVEHFLQYCM